MLQLAASAKSVAHLSRVGQLTIDSPSFRLHHKATTALLILFSLLVTTQDYIGKAIECIPGTKLVGQGAKAATQYCYLQNTFSVKEHFAKCGVGEVCQRKVIGLDIPHHGVGPVIPHDEGAKVYQTYYMWVTFVLFFQAMMFYVPHWLWKMWEGKVMEQLTKGLHDKIIETRTVTEKSAPVAKYMVTSWHLHNMYAIRYILCELMTFVVVILNLVFVNWFLGGVFMDYGSRVLEFTNMDPEERTDPMIMLFPRITKCTFMSVGPSGTYQRTDLLCVLAANIINEKIYIFLWFWFIILAIVTGVNFIYRLLPFFSVSSRFWFLQKKAAHKADMNSLHRIVRRSQIGDFYVLYFLSQNMSSATFGQFIDSLALALDEDGKKPVPEDEESGKPKFPAPGYAQTALAALGLKEKPEETDI